MKQSRRQIIVTLAVFSIFFALAATNSYALDELEIQIDVSPNILNIQSESVVVTIHTDIAYSAVVGSSVYLNGVEIYFYKSDDRGNFVAKFLSDAIKEIDGLIMDDYNTLTLIGLTTDNQTFTGTQDIKVIDIMPQGKN